MEKSIKTLPCNLAYLFLTRQRMTQRASWMDRSASSITSLLEPRTTILTVFPGFTHPVICTHKSHTKPCCHYPAQTKKQNKNNKTSHASLYMENLSKHQFANYISHPVCTRKTKTCSVGDACRCTSVIKDRLPSLVCQIHPS